MCLDSMFGGCNAQKTIIIEGYSTCSLFITSTYINVSVDSHWAPRLGTKSLSESIHNSGWSRPQMLHNCLIPSIPSTADISPFVLLQQPCRLITWSMFKSVKKHHITETPSKSHPFKNLQLHDQGPMPSSTSHRPHLPHFHLAGIDTRLGALRCVASPDKCAASPGCATWHFKKHGKHFTNHRRFKKRRGRKKSYHTEN